MRRQGGNYDHNQPLFCCEHSARIHRRKGDGLSATTPWICNTWQAFQQKVVDKYSASTTYDGTSYTTSDTLILNFYPGNYEVDDFKIGAWSSALGEWMPVRFEIKRYGTGAKPIFKLKDNATIWMAGTDYSDFMYLFHTKGYAKYGRLSDLIFNCNGLGQTTYKDDDTGPTGRRKVGGILFTGYDLAVDRCEVFDFLAKTKQADSGNAEVFPLMLKGFNQISTGKVLVGLAIRDCFVHDLHTIRNGYCTAINMVTLTDDFPSETQDNVYDDSHPSSSSSEAFHICFVERNVVRCIFVGIGLGGRYVQRAVFRNNSVRQASLGFNCDTAGTYPNRVVTIEDNHFGMVDSGINIGGCCFSDSETFNTWFIRRNTFVLRGLCALNSSSSSDTTGVDPDETNCEAYALKLAGGTGNISFTNNTITSVHDSTYTPPSSSSSCDEGPVSQPSGQYYLGVKKLAQCLCYNYTPPQWVPASNGTPILSGNTPTSANQTNRKIFPV